MHCWSNGEKPRKYTKVNVQRETLKMKRRNRVKSLLIYSLIHSGKNEKRYLFTTGHTAIHSNLKTKVHLFFQLFKNLFAQRILHTRQFESDFYSFGFLFVFLYRICPRDCTHKSVLLKILILAPNYSFPWIIEY